MHYTDDKLANLAQQWARITQAARDHHWQAMDESARQKFHSLFQPAEPAQAVVTEPAQAAASEPAQAAIAEPAQAVTTEPVQAAASELAQVAIAEPAQTVIAEPAQTVITEPVRAAESEPTQALVAKPAQVHDRECPFCAESIRAEAVVCKHCRHLVPDRQLTRLDEHLRSLSSAVQNKYWKSLDIPTQRRLTALVKARQVGETPKPVPSRGIAALLAILLGTFGAHHFYLGRPDKGLLYTVLLWTSLPTFIGLVEGVTYVFTSEDEWQKKHSK